jgi:hypothetical protein
MASSSVETVPELDPDIDFEPISDADLEALALAADPDQAIDDDAVPFAPYQGVFGDILPSWYMPAPVARSSGRSRRNVVVVSLIIFSLLLVDAFGLCITYGRLEIPF